MVNPFTASFGVTPPLLVGRDAVLDEFVEAIEDGPGASGRATIYTGARGTGKTVMLNAVEDRARERGWLVISETASPGFVNRISEQALPALLAGFDPDAVQRRLASVAAPMNMGEVSWDTVDRHPTSAGLRNQLELLTELLREHETGVLLTLDEIHHKQIDELRELATTIQHAFREGRDVAFAGAGLASSVSDVVNDDVLTFLRRADRHTLGRVSHSDMERGFREPIEAAGRTVDDDALTVMADGADGYPFLLQLVGAQTWRVNAGQPAVSVADARIGVDRAHQRLATLVHQPALADVSDGDRDFLMAMSIDDGPSKTSDVRDRLGVSDSYASQYRRRLIAVELIRPTRRGWIDFTLPYLREFLRSGG